jgi:phosphatidylserine/phosphatidylglycerophosphate/cardiolipin synthase-like enzyme
MASERSQILCDLIASQSSENIGSFIQALREGRITFVSRSRDLQRVLDGPIEIIQAFQKILETWPEGSAANVFQLADSLEVASLSAQQVTQLPRAELVWTGPVSGHPTARKTYQVLNEMLRHASAKVLIVGYSLFLKGDLAGGLMVELGRLSSRGVKVVFIVDRRYSGWGGDGRQGHSVRQIQQAWPSNTPRPEIFSWASDEDESSKLHAKVLLVDDRDLLVTSANLTGAGMETNLELGVRLQGETARNCADHFAGLVASAFFDLETWPA